MKDLQLDLQLIDCKLCKSQELKSLFKADNECVEVFVQEYAKLLSEKTGLQYKPEPTIEDMQYILSEGILMIGVLRVTEYLNKYMNDFSREKKIPSKNRKLFKFLQKIFNIFLSEVDIPKLEEKGQYGKEISLKLFILLTFEIHHYYYISRKKFEAIGGCLFCRKIFK